MRADHYDPFAHSITSYNNDPAIKAHELGHAEDFRDRKHKTLYTLLRTLYPGALYQEGLASAKAIPILNRKYMADGMEDEEREKQLASANRKLTAAFGTYLGGPAAGAGVVLGALGGNLAGATTQPFGNPVKEERESEGKAKPEEKSEEKSEDEVEVET